MSTTEPTAVLDTTLLHDEIVAVLDDRTLEILEHRRRTAGVRRRGWLVRRMLLVADVLGLSIAFLLSQLLTAVAEAPIDRIDPRVEFLLFLVTLPIWVVMARLYGLYVHDEERTDHSTVDEFMAVFHLATVGAWVIFAGTWLTGVADPDFVKLALFWGFAISLVMFGRVAARAICRRRMAYLQNTVIVGAGEVGQLVARKILQHPEYGINLIGFVDSSPKDRRADLEHLTLLGSPERLPTLITLFDIERVVIAFTNDSHESMLDLIRSLRDLDVQIDIVPRLFEVVGTKIGVHTVEGLTLVGLPPLRLSSSARFLKRTLDIVGAAAVLVLLSPVLGAIAIAIRLDSSGPAHFHQVRRGSGGRIFRIRKFRTMVVDADELKARLAHLNKHAQPGGDPRMFKVPDDPRVTRVGRFLRRYSLDELPQLLNVLKGDMSLVGPRPLILDEDRHVGEWARKRLDLKPGITGLWQVLGRSEIPFEEMVKLDYIYVTSWSLSNDLSLIARTVPALWRARSAY